MNWVKNNWMPLAAGFAVGYFVARRGGITGTVAAAKSKASSVAG